MPCWSGPLSLQLVLLLSRLALSYTCTAHTPIRTHRYVQMCLHTGARAQVGTRAEMPRCSRLGLCLVWSLNPLSWCEQVKQAGAPGAGLSGACSWSSPRLTLVPPSPQSPLVSVLVIEHFRAHTCLASSMLSGHEAHSAFPPGKLQASWPWTRVCRRRVLPAQLLLPPLQCCKVSLSLVLEGKYTLMPPCVCAHRGACVSSPQAP